ncbi:MAG TPA: type II toxin-antitoxin system HicA family toxin [Anaerolineae bacterium]|nr:type II toxin-antitoxin system HicA family toxin [Anaerolineae bacterium]
MARSNKVLDKVARGTSDANIRFDDLRQLLRSLGFTERIRGSHHIFFKESIEEILNLQTQGANAKPYQVKQVRNVIETQVVQSLPVTMSWVATRTKPTYVRGSK